MTSARHCISQVVCRAGTFLDLCALPLPNAGAASVGQDSAANLLEHLEQSVASNGSPDLLTAGSNGEGDLESKQPQLACGSINKDTQ